MLNSPHKIILASSSPQRKNILQELGLNFTVAPSRFEEIVPPNAEPVILAKDFALGKARDVAKIYPQNWALGVDTIVVTETNELLLKPVNRADARRILQKLSGSKQTVISGIALVKGKRKLVRAAKTTVYFKKLNEQEIENWLDSNLWQGRSGGFQIDGPGGFFVKKIVGDFYNVVGLPVYLLGKMLTAVSKSPPD